MKPLLQPKLPNNCSVKVIGLGGVGSIVARYAAVFLASLGRANLYLIDGDDFEPSNTSRMLFGTYANKAAVILAELNHKFDHSILSFMWVGEYVDGHNLKRLVLEKDIVLLCVDNHKTRQLVNDHCARLKNITLISGGNDGVGHGKRGTYGNVQVYLRRRGRDITFPLDHYHPEIKRPADKHPQERSCTDLLVHTPQILFANLAVASAMLNALLLCLGGAEHYSEVSFDIAEALMRPTIPLKTNKGKDSNERER